MRDPPQVPPVWDSQGLSHRAADRDLLGLPVVVRGLNKL